MLLYHGSNVTVQFPQIIHSARRLDFGPVANDNTMPVINLYFSGVYTEEEALKRLLPQNLKDQFAFKTEKALNFLTFKETKSL